MLTERDVVPYLLTRGLLNLNCIADGDISVIDASRRNHNFIVISSAGRYLLKHGADRERVKTIAREAFCYQALSSKVEAKSFAPYLPGFYDYDAEKHVLILQFVEGAETLRQKHERLGRSSTGTAQQLADALAALHQMQVDSSWEVPPPRIPAHMLHRPSLEIFRDLGSAEAAVIRIIQNQRKLGDLLDQLRDEWNASAVIHGDLRGDNLLFSVAPASASGRWPKFIDFEFTGRGDPAADVGAIFADYLGTWIRSLPLIGPGPSDRFIGLAKWPLKKVQPPIRSFWLRYIVSTGLDDSQSRALIARAVGHCGARLLHQAIEMANGASSVNATQACLLQVGVNVLLQPKKAVSELLGLSFQRKEAR